MQNINIIGNQADYKDSSKEAQSQCQTLFLKKKCILAENCNDRVCKTAIDEILESCRKEYRNSKGNKFIDICTVYIYLIIKTKSSFKVSDTRSGYHLISKNIFFSFQLQKNIKNSKHISRNYYVIQLQRMRVKNDKQK